MLRTNLRIAIFGTAIFWLVSLLGCATANAEPNAGEETLAIANIISSPEKYEGKTVTLSGEYRGWEAGYGSPPVTRSDWILKDETGGIYITSQVSAGLGPTKDISKKITVSGIVRVKGSQVYIEAKTLRQSGY